MKRIYIFLAALLVLSAALLVVAFTSSNVDKTSSVSLTEIGHGIQQDIQYPYTSSVESNDLAEEFNETLSFDGGGVVIEDYYPYTGPDQNKSK